MITRSLSHRWPRRMLPAGERQRPVVGPRHKSAFPRCDGARRPGVILTGFLPSPALLAGDGEGEGSRTSGEGDAVEQLLVVYYLPEQSDQRVERELQRRQCEREQ